MADDKLLLINHHSFNIKLWRRERAGAPSLRDVMHYLRGAGLTGTVFISAGVEPVGVTLDLAIAMIASPAWTMMVTSTILHPAGVPQLAPELPGSPALSTSPG